MNSYWKRGFLMFVVGFTASLIVSDAEAQLLRRRRRMYNNNSYSSRSYTSGQRMAVPSASVTAPGVGVETGPGGVNVATPGANVGVAPGTAGTAPARARANVRAGVNAPADANIRVRGQTPDADANLRRDTNIPPALPRIPQPAPPPAP